MVTMEIKGITWVGDIYQKFENMCLEAEEVIYEDTVKYLENQVQNVGESVKRFYADILQDLLPPSSCDLDEKELPIDEDTDVEYKKSILGPKQRPSKADIKQTNKVLRINPDIDNAVTCATSYDKSCGTNVLLTSASGKSVKVNKFDSHVRQRVRSTKARSNLAPTKTSVGVSSTETETETGRTEVSNEKLDTPHQVDTISNVSLAEVATSDLVSDCCDEKEIESESENESAEQIPDLPISDDSADAEMKMSPSSSDVLSGELNGFSTEIQSDDYSHSTVILSHPDGWNFNVDTVAEEECDETAQNDGLKLEQSCVMVSSDELRLVHNSHVDLRTNKKKMRQVFAFGKKSSRKQEYEQLAVLHRKSENSISPSSSSSSSSLGGHKKLLLPSVSESEWEVL